jgi:hypothetical protein
MNQMKEGSDVLGTTNRDYGNEPNDANHYRLLAIHVMVVSKVVLVNPMCPAS